MDRRTWQGVEMQDVELGRIRREAMKWEVRVVQRN